MPPLSPLLRLKSRIATSALAGSVAMLRGAMGRVRAVIHPELGLLYQEGRLTDACLAKLIHPAVPCALGQGSVRLRTFQSFCRYPFTNFFAMPTPGATQG